MNLSEKIMALYPSLTPQDFIKELIVLQDDSNGKGAYIAKGDYYAGYDLTPFVNAI